MRIHAMSLPAQAAATIALAAIILCAPCGEARAQVEEEVGSIHAMEWNANKDIVARDNMVPRALIRQPLAERKVNPLRRKVVGFHPQWVNASYRSYTYGLLTTILYFGCDLDTATGEASNVYSWPTTNLVNVAHAAGVGVCLVATNFGAKANAAILRSPAKRGVLIDRLVRLVSDRAAEGVNIDFESVAYADRDSLVVFMRDLSAAFHQAIADPEISICIPAVDWRDAYDVAALASICDYLILMGYDYHYAKSETAGAIAPLAGERYNVTTSVADYLARSVPASRLVLGVPYYGYSWPTVNSSKNARTTARAVGHPVSYADHKSHALEEGQRWDLSTASPWYGYRLAGTWYQAWFEDSMSLSMKYDIVDSLDLAGISIWALSYDAPYDELWHGLQTAFGSDSTTFSYADFQGAEGLTLTGAAVQRGGHVCLLSDPTVTCGEVWRTAEQDVQRSFATSFRFAAGGDPSSGGTGGEPRFAFGIHHGDAADPGTREGERAGEIPNSIMLEFGRRQGSDAMAALPNVVRVRLPVKEPTMGVENGVPNVSCPIPDLFDGMDHEVCVRYDAGRLRLSIDGRSEPYVDVPLDIAACMSLGHGKARVGFVGSNTSNGATVDLTHWTFTGYR